mmetsp:Transcript_16327/g.18357  ORF Transcript_16327/g.18357 Transcript_16327/m.18357 type:complete len:91 (-) Transcript_16327:1565-1837(-)
MHNNWCVLQFRREISSHMGISRVSAVPCSIRIKTSSSQEVPSLSTRCTVSTTFVFVTKNVQVDEWHRPYPQLCRNMVTAAVGPSATPLLI